MNDETLSWLALATVPQIGPVRCRSLINHFGSPSRALKAGHAELKTLPEIGPKVAAAIKEGVDYKKAESQFNLLKNSPYNFLTFSSPEYPERLKNIYDPPFFLFCDGDISCLALPAVAIVGSRSLSTYGRMMAEKLARELAEAGITVVSGFARGIDTVAHQHAIEANGKTVAVFGNGLDVIYPPENKSLYRDLVLNGCAISEFFLGEQPLPQHFPRRNRIISGLSLGVVVVEAGSKSGALLTAQHALEQGREVFAVPGNITSSTSKGANKIIKDGARLVTSVEDILEELKFLVPSKKPPSTPGAARKLTGNHKKVYEILGDEPIQIDRIVNSIGLSVSSALEILLDLELNGLVRQVSGKMFVRQV